MITKDLFFVLWGNGQVCSWWFRVLVWTRWFEVRPRRASELAVCKGLESPRACRCCGTEERSIGILHSGNPSCVESGDVEQVGSNLETYPCVCDCHFSLSISISLFISCISYLVFTYLCMIYSLCSFWYIAWDCLLTLVFNQESQRGTSTHSRGI